MHHTTRVVPSTHQTASGVGKTTPSTSMTRPVGTVSKTNRNSRTPSAISMIGPPIMIIAGFAIPEYEPGPAPTHCLKVVLSDGPGGEGGNHSMATVVPAGNHALVGFVDPKVALMSR